jgi:hypothetical protein
MKHEVEARLRSGDETPSKHTYSIAMNISWIIGGFRFPETPMTSDHRAADEFVRLNVLLA